MFHVLEAGPPRPPPPKFPPAAKVTNIYKGCSSNLAFSDSKMNSKMVVFEHFFKLARGDDRS